MAEEVISTRIVANADFSSLIADVHKVTASLSKLQEQLASSNKMLANQVAVINRSFADTLRSTGQFSTHFVSLQSDVERFGKNLDGGKLKLRDYFNTFQAHAKTSGGLIRDLAKQQVALQNSILQPLGRNAQGLMQFNVHVPRGLDEIKNKTSLARQELAIMNKVIQDGAGQLINWGKNTQWAGRQLTVGLTVPMAAFGKAAADAFRLADQELVRLTKVYGDVAGTSAAELGKVREEVVATSKELSASYGTNFRETISLAADIAATGKQGQELLDSVKETSRLAVLGEVDRQEAMKATLAIQSAFKSNTEELSQSINFLNAVENQTSTTLQDLVEAIPKAGPVIKGLGGSVQDLALYLTAMREGGISASEGANALKSALASLINPTDVAVAKFQSFGIDLLGIVNKNAGNVTGTLLELQAGLDRLNPLQKQQAIEQLFGKFQFSRLNALFENLGRQGSQTLQVLDLMKASASDLEAVAGRELAAVTESASGKYKRAVESLKADLAGLGESFLTIGTQIINVIDKTLKFFESLPKPIKNALTFVGALTAMAGPLIMLTGVLANFFGYVLKGIMHMKAFFKGGEGWKYLTPEMLAAEKAGKLVEQTFYSDAKAAAILQTALRNLIDEFSILEGKAKSGAMSVNPAVSTMAGNLIMGAGGGRVVNPQHPLAGPMGTRASTHMVPRASMSEEQRMSQTIFGLVPGAVPVNRKIGDAPQIYMNEQLPNVPGLTTIGGVSTGVVSGEAARWHAMMATLAMQSKAEIEQLKKQIATTGVVSKDFMNQFDDILPVVSGITDNAAKQSSLIVAELRAGKINVEQARAQIIALNLEIERMITAAVGQVAAGMGRTINPTMVPTLNQPVVDPTGKSNMRELFKKSKTRDLIDKVSRSLGVRTSGAGYNIETTRPKKMNMGGQVYMSSGSIVPGPDVNADVVPAMLTPGEFVVNREATAANLPLLMAINGGRGSSGPGYLTGGQIKTLIGLPQTFMQRSLLVSGARRSDTRSGRQVYSPGALNYEQMGSRAGRNSVWNNPALAMGRPGSDEVVGHIYSNPFYRQFGAPGSGSSPRMTGSIFERATGLSLPRSRSGYTGTYDVLPNQFMTISRAFNTKLNRGNATPSDWFANPRRPEHLLSLMHLLTSSGIPASRALPIAQKVLSRINSNISRLPANVSISERMFGNIVTNSTRAELNSLAAIGHLNARQNAMNPLPRGTYTPGAYRGYNRNRRNSGGMIYMNRGGMVPGVRYYNEGGGPVKGMGMGTTLAGLGLQTAGQSIGGGVGSAMSSAGMALTFMPMLNMIPKVNVQLSNMQKKLIEPIGPLNRLNAGMLAKAKSLSGLSRAFGPVLRGLSLLTRAFSPMGIAITAGIFGVKKLIEAYKNHQETLRINRLEFGMSSDALKKAGYSMTNYNEQIKKGIESAKALQERNRMLYESMFQAGIPIKMTIAEYKKLRAEVKEKMPDLIQLFNQKSNSEINSVATRLKAQFMSMGDSVETATAKVYALMSQSNKAQFAAAAIGSKGFGAIRTSIDAAIASAGNFDDAMVKGDSKAAADSLMITFEGIGRAIEDNAKKNKIEFSESMDQVLKKMATTGKGQVAINQSVLAELKKQNPELAKILNSTDTATSAWAKYQLAIKGVNLDLKNLSAQAATSALQLNELVTQTTVSALKNTDGVKQQYAAYDKLQARIKDLQKAAKGQSVQSQIDARKEIESLNKRIAKIKEAADAKIKAIRSQKQAEDDNLEIQELQLKYQNALAQGDRDAAAQALIDLQKKTNEVQSRKAEENILAKAELEIKPLQDRIDALGKKNQELADKAALAGESLSKLQGQASTLKDKLSTLEKALSSAAFNKLILGESYEGSKQQQADLAAVEAGRRDLGMPKSVVTITGKQHPKSTVTSRTAVLDVPGGAKDLTSQIVKEMSVQAQVVNLVGNIKTGGGAPAGGWSKSMPKTIASSSSYKTEKDGFLDNNAKRSILLSNPDLGSGSYFQYGNTKYKVNSVVRGNYNGTPYISSMDVVAQKSLGGPVAAGRKYMINDRINPMGFQQEIFVPNVSGNIYPNADTMPRFNIPGKTPSGFAGGVNSSYNNNVYNIDIDLNGTNVSVDDIMRRMKAEMALIGARQGTNRIMGGSY